jgi:hypothetical protein
LQLTAAGAILSRRSLSADNFGQFINHRTLLINRKLRIANDVDEEYMGDLKLDLFLDLSGHITKSDSRSA